MKPFFQRSKCLFFILLFLPFTFSFAQWTVLVTCESYPSPYLSDWENNPGIVNIEIRYDGVEPETVKLVDSLYSFENGFIAKGSSEIIIFDAAQTIFRDNRDFLNYRGINYNPSYREAIIRTNRLLEGTYTLYCNLIRLRTGELLVSGNPVNFTILGFSIPSLLTPADGDTVRIASPTFQWTQATSHPGFEVHYSIKVCEVLDGQLPTQAINNIAHHQDTIVDFTSFLYPNFARALEEDKSYVWQIQAHDRNSLPIGENNGRSEIFSFFFQPLPIGFEISNLDLTVPSLISVGSSVQAKVKFNVVGSGDVRGRFLIDNIPWRDFSQHTSTSPDSFYSLSLPSAEVDIGQHNLKIEISEPNILKDSVTYEVTREVTSLDSLLLVPGVAKIKSISDPLIPDGPPGSNRFRLAGTATMHLLSLDNISVPACTISNLKIVLNPHEPFNSTIDTGLVRRSVAEDTALFGYKEDFLKVTSVKFEKRGTPVDFISLDAKLNLPRINITLYRLNDLVVRSTGIVGKDFSTIQEFSKWGVTFSLKDVGPAKAIRLGYEHDTLWASFCGDIKLSRNGAPSVLTQFANFKITHQGKISGRFGFADPFRLIPENAYLKLDTLTFLDSLNQYYLKFIGRVESLPKPIDTIVRRTNFSFLLDMDGNTAGAISPLNELSPDRRGEANDISEFNIPFINIRLDLTYLGLILTIQDNDLKLNQSRIEMAMDVYFPFKNNAGDLLPVDQRRLAIGELRGERLEGAITIDFNGHLNWNLPVSIPLIRNKQLDLGDVIKLKLQQMVIEPLPFAFVLNCSLGINIAGVDGGVQLEGVKIFPSGEVSYPVIRGGEFNILEVFKVSVGLIRWANKDTTFTMNQDQTTGEGEDRNFQREMRDINCSSYLLMEQALINIGPGGTVASGDFERLLVYKTGESKKVSIIGADVSITGMELLADFDYSNPIGNLRFAGTLNIPSGIGLTAVGKIGNRDGNTSLGLFVAARGLNIPVGPGVMLTGVGGGFFLYPEEIDLSTVRRHCGFRRPEMENKFQEKKANTEDPGGFALLLYGEVEIAGTDELVWGKALVTLTTRRFDLDAEVKVLKATDMAEGLCYLSIGWNPAYAEGRIEVDVDVVNLITGEGHFEFYVYSSDAWGVMGGADLEVIRVVDASADFFVGNPGFLLEMEFDYGIDIYVLSGNIDFNGMVWYKQVVPKSWGGYAGLRASAEILGGLAGASFGLEGALIGEPHYLIYCVGSLSVEVCWVEVFSGSIWVSIGSNGFDGGTGRNSRYDGIIEDAREVADQMQEEKENVRDAIAGAQESMYELSNEQREKAGLALVEAAGWQYDLYRSWFDIEVNNWTRNIGYFPSILRSQRDSGIFDPVSNELKRMRDSLNRKERLTRNFINRIDDTRSAVDRRLAGYRAILEERLPTIREIGFLRTPLREKNRQRVIVSGTDTSFTITPQIGFDINYDQADEQKNSVSNTKADNEQYRQELLRIIGLIDNKLVKLDSLLFYSDRSQRNNMALLCSLYQAGYQKVLDYYWDLGDYIDKNQKNAASKITFFNRRIGARNCRAMIDSVLDANVRLIDSMQLFIWTGARRELIYNVLLDTPVQDWPVVPRRLDTLRTMWKNFGQEIWYFIPKAGYQSIIRNAQVRWDTMKNVYKRSTNRFSGFWIGYTNSLDRVYSRKAKLYELLYDLHDQLDLMGDVPTPESRRWIIVEGIRQAMLQRPLDPGRIGPLIVPKKEQLARLLTNPQIIRFSGLYQSDNTTPANFGRLDLDWIATHPEGVVDYSFYLKRETEPGKGGGLIYYPRSSFKTLGRSRNIWQPFISGINEPGNYQVFLKARGAGGYTITRKGVVPVAYYGPEVSPQRNRMNTIDSTPPTRPRIITDTLIASTGEINARWRSQDAESGVEEYQYAIDKLVYSQITRTYIPVPILNFTSSGGRTEMNIRNLKLSHNQTHILKVQAKNDVGLWSDFGQKSIRVDTSPPTEPTITEFIQSTYQRKPNTVFTRWQESEDSESGVLHYVYCLGRRPLGTEVKDWDTIPLFPRIFYAPGLPIRNGDTVFVTLRTYNRAGLYSQDTSSCVFSFTDSTPPSTLSITRATYTNNDSILSASWSASDAESGISDYQYQIEEEVVVGRYPDFKRVRRVLEAWTSNGTQTSIQKRINPTPAYIKVKAINGVGLIVENELRITSR